MIGTEVAWANTNFRDDLFKNIFFAPMHIGIFPFTFSYDITKTTAVFSIIYWLVYLPLHLYSLTFSDLNRYSYNKVEFTFILIESYSLLQVNIFIQVWSIIKIDCMRKIVKEINWIERTLRWNGLQLKWRPTIFHVYGNIVFSVCVYIFFCFQTSTLNEGLLKGLDTSWFYFGAIVLFSTVNQYTCLASLISSLMNHVMMFEDSSVMLSSQEAIFNIIDILLEFYGPLLLVIVSYLYIPLLYPFYCIFTFDQKFPYYIWGAFSFWPLLQIVFFSQRALNTVRILLVKLIL